MIAGTPWPPAAGKPIKPQPPAAALSRRIPALLLALVCCCSVASVVLLVVLPTTGAFAPLGADFALLHSPIIGWSALAAYLAVWVLAVASAVAAWAATIPMPRELV